MSGNFRIQYGSIHFPVCMEQNANHEHSIRQKQIFFCIVFPVLGTVRGSIEAHAFGMCQQILPERRDPFTGNRPLSPLFRRGQSKLACPTVPFKDNDQFWIGLIDCKFKHNILVFRDFNPSMAEIIVKYRLLYHRFSFLKFL